MSFKTFFSEQAKNPSGLFGHVVMSEIFDLGNAPMNNFMKEQLELKENDHVLEIGFGTGKLLKDMSKLINKGVIEGIDTSDAMVRIAEKRNKKLINRGRVIIKHGDFEKVNYDESSFDKICSANTIYFWSDPHKIIKKIINILKPGGRLILVFGDKNQLKERSLDSDIFRFYSESEVKDLLLINGFSENITVKSKMAGSNKFHCGIAEKKGNNDGEY